MAWAAALLDVTKTKAGWGTPERGRAGQSVAEASGICAVRGGYLAHVRSSLLATALLYFLTEAFERTILLGGLVDESGTMADFVCPPGHPTPRVGPVSLEDLGLPEPQHTINSSLVFSNASGLLELQTTVIGNASETFDFLCEQNMGPPTSSLCCMSVECAETTIPTTKSSTNASSTLSPRTAASSPGPISANTTYSVDACRSATTTQAPAESDEDESSEEDDNLPESDKCTVHYRRSFLGATYWATVSAITKGHINISLKAPLSVVTWAGIGLSTPKQGAVDAFRLRTKGLLGVVLEDEWSALGWPRSPRPDPRQSLRLLRYDRNLLSVHAHFSRALKSSDRRDVDLSRECVRLVYPWSGGLLRRGPLFQPATSDKKYCFYECFGKHDGKRNSTKSSKRSTDYSRFRPWMIALFCCAVVMGIYWTINFALGAKRRFTKKLLPFGNVPRLPPAASPPSGVIFWPVVPGLTGPGREPDTGPADGAEVLERVTSPIPTDHQSQDSQRHTEDKETQDGAKSTQISENKKTQTSSKTTDLGYSGVQVIFFPPRKRSNSWGDLDVKDPKDRGRTRSEKDCFQGPASPIPTDRLDRASSPFAQRQTEDKRSQAGPTNCLANKKTQTLPLKRPASTISSKHQEEATCPLSELPKEGEKEKRRKRNPGASEKAPTSTNAKSTPTSSKKTDGGFLAIDLPKKEKSKSWTVLDAKDPKDRGRTRKLSFSPCHSGCHRRKSLPPLRM